MENETIQFGSDELKEIIEQNSQFAKFDIGKVYKIEIMSPEILPRMANFDGKETQRYDIKIKVSDEEKIWSVSRTVLTTIAKAWDNTKVFNVMRNEKSYSVIPLEK